MINFVNSKKNIDKFIRMYTVDPAKGEPTFLTFSLDFQFDPLFIQALHMYNSPLLISGETAKPMYSTNNGKADPSEKLIKNSALAYFKGRGLAANYARIHKFIEILHYLNDNEPWFFQSVSGLKSLWESGSSVEPGNFKGKDKVIDIATLESLDLSITYLADLYRKSVYDTVYMREVLPENLRYFQLDIYVAEFRNLKVLDTVLPMPNFLTKNKDFFINYSTFYKFSCYMCEFDFSQTFAGGDTLEIKGPDEPATNNFSIKVNNFIEQHQFGFNDIVTADTWGKYKFEKIFVEGKEIQMNMNQVFGMFNDVKNAARNVVNFAEDLGDNLKSGITNNAAVNTGRNFVQGVKNFGR